MALANLYRLGESDLSIELRLLSPFSNTMWQRIKEHSLSIAFALLFAGFIFVTLWFGPGQFRAERNLPPDTEVTQSAAYWDWWVYNTALSLEADIFGGLLLVLLTKKLMERGSAESK